MTVERSTMTAEQLDRIRAAAETGQADPEDLIELADLVTNLREALDDADGYLQMAFWAVAGEQVKRLHPDCTLDEIHDATVDSANAFLSERIRLLSKRQMHTDN